MQTFLMDIENVICLSTWRMSVIETFEVANKDKEN